MMMDHTIVETFILPTTSVPCIDLTIRSLRPTDSEYTLKIGEKSLRTFFSSDKDWEKAPS